LSYPPNPLLLSQLFSRNGLSHPAIEHQIWLCHLPNTDDFGANLCGKASRKVTFSTVPGVSFVFHFSALFFFTAQSSARCYHPSASPVLYPEDGEDPSNPPLRHRMNFSFLCCPVSFHPFCCSKMKRKGRPTNGNPSQFCGFSEEKRTAGARNGRWILSLDLAKSEVDWAFQ
jgi:hypothetical protein